MTRKKNICALSTTHIRAQGKTIAIPSIDWLQLDFRGSFIRCASFDWKLLDISTRHFSKIQEARKKEFPIFEVVYEPKSSIIPQDLHLCKLNNRELYWLNPVKRLIQYAKDCNLFYNRVSRVDLCLDFTSFSNNYNPENFIKDFMSGKYISRKKRNGQANFKHGDNLEFNYLRLQNKRSFVSVYLYNKSKEMRDVKKKNYIIKKWEVCGLDTTKDVWRLEFSIHNAKFDIINKVTKVKKQFDVNLIDDNFYLNDVLQVLIDNYFTFYHSTNSRARNCKKKLHLFNFNPTKQVIQFRDDSMSTNRGDIMFINKLRELNDELRRAKRGEAQSCKEVLNYVKKTRQL
jgi:hypothetical protein